MSLKTKWIEFLYRVATGSGKARNLLTPIGAASFGLFTALFVTQQQKRSAIYYIGEKTLEQRISQVLILTQALLVTTLTLLVVPTGTV